MAPFHIFLKPTLFYTQIKRDCILIGLYEKNLKPAKFERSLSIIHAPATIAKLLDIKKDRLIYCIEFIGRTQDNQIVEYTKSFMDTSKIRFEYTLTKD